MNDADRLSLDPVMQGIVGGHAVTKQAASNQPDGALLDRLTHRVHILEMNGGSYRLNQNRRRQNSPAK